MERRKQEPELVPQPQAEAKKRRFRLIKVEEQRFHIDALEQRAAPASIVSHRSHLSLTRAGQTLV